MHCKRCCRVALACVVVFGLTNVAIAKLEATLVVGIMSLDGWGFETRDGQLGLAKIDSRHWHANAPVIYDEKGLFISANADGKTPTVQMVQEKTENSKWAFEFLEHFKPKLQGRGEGYKTDMWVGRSGYRFKMKVAEGPFKDWYVAVDPLTEEAQADPEKTPQWRPLKLVRDPKLAAEIEYVRLLHRRTD